jgi:lipoprotein-releasing system permease protein
MRLDVFFAYRYLFSKKSKGIIRLISSISMIVVAFVAAAMIIVMSAFQGIESLVDDLFSHFDPPIVIQSTSGKFFDNYRIPTALLEDSRVLSHEQVLESDVWIHYQDADAVIQLKGVSSTYGRNSGMDQLMKAGTFDLSDTVHCAAIPGLGVCGELKMPVAEHLGQTFQLRAPIPGKKLSRYRENAFSEMEGYTMGVFSANAELDVKYVFVPLNKAERLLNRTGSVSSCEVYLKSDADPEEFQSDWKEALQGDSLSITTRNERNALIYKTTQSEKWATFAILMFILLIATFNIVAALSMMMIEKKKDIYVLQSMGASVEFIRNVFTLEGVLVNLLGTLVGLGLGVLICWVQQTFGIITMQGAVVESYPVELTPGIIVGIGLTVITTGSLFCFIMVRVLWKNMRLNLLEN